MKLREKNILLFILQNKALFAFLYCVLSSIVILCFLFFTEQRNEVVIKGIVFDSVHVQVAWKDNGRCFLGVNTKDTILVNNKKTLYVFSTEGVGLKLLQISINSLHKSSSLFILQKLITRHGSHIEVYEGEKLSVLHFQNAVYKQTIRGLEFELNDTNATVFFDNQGISFSERFKSVSNNVISILLFLVGGAIGLFFIFYFLWWLNISIKSYLAYFLFFCFFVSICIAIISPFLGHPDEEFHQSAVTYYTTHFFPKHQDDPEVQCHYDWSYNVSRLDATGFSYFVIAKISQIWGWIINNPLINYRMVQCLFLLLLVLASLRYTNALHLVIPVVLTPQSWYSFSYINDEAFPIFMSFIVCFEILCDNSLLNIYVKNGVWWKKILYVAVFSIAFSNVIYAKLNFLVFVLFVPILLLYKLISNSSSRLVYKRIIFPRLSMRYVKKYGIAFLMAIVLAGSYFAVYFYIHSDYNKPVISIEQEKMMQARQANSDNCKKTLFTGFHLSEKGTKYFDMLPNWLETTFQSSFGIYGWMDVFAAAPLYRMFGVTFFFFIFFYLAFIFHRASFYDIVMSIICLLFIVFMLFVSSYLFSWKYDYQPQGRYLFPMLPVLGVFFYIGQKYVPKYLTISFVSAMFALSVYSISCVLMPYYF